MDDTNIRQILEADALPVLAKLKELRVMHRDLDDLIDRLSHDATMDQVRLRRLKKRKLLLKDAIARLESEIIPDLNA
ncbi:MAG: DUF465 domain-containing protein [Pseudomonadota bacterium]